MAPLPGFSSGLLRAHTSLQTFQILQKCSQTLNKSSHFNGTMSFDLCIKNSLTLYLSKMPETFFSPNKCCHHLSLQVLLHHKSSAANAEIKTQKDVVVFSQFEITIIQINYNLLSISVLYSLRAIDDRIQHHEPLSTG